MNPLVGIIMGSGLSVQISVKPTQLIWGLSQVQNVTPNLDVTQVVSAQYA
jgi:hypothetical protein